MKILVTGGAGFIGNHLVNALIKRKNRVVVVDNLSTGVRENINPKAKFYKADITDFSRMNKIFGVEKPEIVFHLAAQADARKSIRNAREDIEINILGSLNVIELSIKNKVKKFIFSSSGGAIYGDTENRPTIEENSEYPLSPYGISKLTIDKYLNYYHKTLGLHFVSLRYANVYGPKQNSKGEFGVVAIFIDRMLSGEAPVINGSGAQTRDYVFIDDIVRANILALEHFEKNGIFNVGTGVETSLLELFKNINNYFGENKFKRFHTSLKLGEQESSCLDCSKIKKELKWKPEIEFPEGIKRTFEWLKEQKINLNQ